MPEMTLVAVVTGAGRGIGRATARMLSRSHVVVACSRTASELAEVAEGHTTIIPMALDIAAADSPRRLADEAERHGRLAVWVNNAATLDVTAVVDIDDSAWRRTMDVNLDATFRSCREALGRMRGTGGGTIVNIGSLSGVPSVEKFPGLAAYNVSKAGVIALTEAVALEGRDAGVRCVALSPGAVDTALLRRAAPHLRAGMTPEDVAAIIDLLLRDAAAPLSGINIPVFSNR